MFICFYFKLKIMSRFSSLQQLINSLTKAERKKIAILLHKNTSESDYFYLYKLLINYPSKNKEEIKELFYKKKLTATFNTATNYLFDSILKILSQLRCNQDSYFKLFNMLMNAFGFKAVSRQDVKHDELCNHLEKYKLPCVIGGNFSSVSSVQGHMNCLIGFNNIGMQEFIVNDPYGNALKGYQPVDGKYEGIELHYGTKFFLKGPDQYWTVLIEKI